MKRYTASLHAEFTIEAENIVQARQVAKRIRSIGEVSGWKGGPHDRRGVRYCSDRIWESVTVRRAGPGEDKEGKETNNG